jgi:sugar phosphate isomerase/epimerase
MNRLNRREFIHTAALASLTAGTVIGGAPKPLAAEVKPRKMTMNLVCGNIGFSATQPEAIDLAARYGFESVEVNAGYLASLTEEPLAKLKGLMKAKGLVFGAAGLPVEFRRDEARFNHDLEALPSFAAALQRAGVDRAATWLMPCHDTLPYLRNFRQHAARLRAVANVLRDHGVRLGLEYVAPKTTWASRRYPFIHTMAEMKELIAELNAGNVGFVLDSWHWWHAGDSASDVLSLKAVDVVAVDLNDAPAGIPKDAQVDNHRELPCATGVIDVGAFLSALNQIGYDGPVRAEPFNQAVNKLSKEEACAATAEAVKRAFALIASS